MAQSSHPELVSYELKRKEKKEKTKKEETRRGRQPKVSPVTSSTFEHLSRPFRFAGAGVSFSVCKLRFQRQRALSCSYGFSFCGNLICFASII